MSYFDNFDSDQIFSTLAQRWHFVSIFPYILYLCLTDKLTDRLTGRVTGRGTNGQPTADR